MKKKVFIMLCLFAVCGVLRAGETAIFSATDDAFVDSSLGSTVINENFLSIQGTYLSGFNLGSVQASFLKFDFGTVPQGATITEAALGVYYYSKNRLMPNSTIPVAELYYVENDSWDETTLTWNNQPDAADASFASQQLGDFKYYEWDLLTGPGNQLNNADLADRELSVMLATAKEDKNNFARFYSSENGELTPYLRISYTNPVPAPGAITLAMLGMGSVLATRKRNK